MYEVINNVCSQTDLPFCKVLVKSAATYTSRSFSMGKIRICSPSTLILLMTIIFCTLRMINNVKINFTALGRKEMKVFFYLYITSISFDMLLISKLFNLTNDSVYTVVLALQLALTNTCVFCLLVGSFTTLYMISNRFMSGALITNVLSFAYFMSILPIIYFALVAKKYELFFIVIFACNTGMVVAFFLTQLLTLKILKTEIWAYGTILLGFLFFAMAVGPLFYGCDLLALLTERYFDGLFCFHLFIFCAIIMIHKFWLSTCENESECTPLKIGKKVLNM